MQQILYGCHPSINTDVPIANIITFNPQLNRVPILWRFRHFYGTDVNMFAYAVTIIVNMTIYTLWLNRGHVL